MREMKVLRRHALALVAMAAVRLAAAEAPAVPNDSCLACHEWIPAEKRTKDVDWNPAVQTLHPAGFAASVHARLQCVACHATIKEVPHEDKLPPAQCGSCHAAATAAYAASIHGVSHARGASAAATCTGCHGDAHAIVASGRPDSPVSKQNLAQTCGRCHSDPRLIAAYHLNPHTADYYRDSIHGQAVAKPGASPAPSCSNCHGSHGIRRTADPEARTNHANVAQTCGECHAREAADFAGSVHAAALRRGAADSPSCPDCHGVHDIRAHTDPASPVFAANLAEQVCARCHASLPLNRKYGLAGDVFQTFADSYHGLAERGGAVAVANCASCHGAHAIKESSDPTSSVNPANLAQTCGRCHAGANARFALGAVHVTAVSARGRDGGSPPLHWIASLYVGLIVLVIGGMVAHNALDFLKKVRRKLALQKGEVVEPPPAHRLYLRMSAHERLQHAALGLSFTLLVVTGFMLRYPDAWWVVSLRRLTPRAFELRGLLHRAAGVVMLGTGVWHLAYVALTRRGRELFRALLPRGRDFTDPWKVARYNLGLAPDKPRFERFCYIEKAEYWAVMWGSIVMGATGAILWFDNWSMGLLTKLGFDIARTVHFYEAVLAALAILVWHFYWVVFNPDVYPMNLAWLTGRMSEGEMREEHPLELEKLQDQEPDRATDHDHE
jgi:cytochrome b subunit of formate dehydrogenase